MNRVSLVIALVAAGAACSEPQNNAPTQLNLDRPVDIAFACYGPMRVTNGRTTPMDSDPTIFTAQPTTSCAKRSEEPVRSNPDDPTSPLQTPTPPGQEGVDVPTWFGFILQSATGTVAVAHWPIGPSRTFVPGTALVDDADELTPGKNSISVGEEPIAIATDKSGCYEVIANAGSCDLSTLDITSAVDDNPGTLVKVNRVPVTNADGAPILARPAAMVAEPNTDEVGNLCGANPSGRMYIAYPSCHLVAAVDSATGKMVGGLKYETVNGVTTVTVNTDGKLTCPAECTDETTRPGTLTSGARPVSLSLDVPTPGMGRSTVRRLAIGAEGMAQVVVVDLDDATFMPVQSLNSPLLVPLKHAAPEPGATEMGVTALAISPVIRMGGGNREGVIDDKDDSPGGPGQYVYAITTDGTVRVVDVLANKRECDTQIDGRFLRTDQPIPRLQCLPIDDPALPRRARARGPGIELPGDAVPLSVAFFRADRVPGTMRPQSTDTPPQFLDDPRTTVIGYFAVVTATTGFSYVVNVDDDLVLDRFGTLAERFNDSDPLGTQPVLVIPHQLRDTGRYRGATAVPTPGGDDRGENPPACNAPSPSAEVPVGGPRATAEPARNLNGGPIASNKAGELPSLRSVTCQDIPTMDKPPTVPVSELAFTAPVEVRSEVFPDLRAVPFAEQWSLAWEGSLSLDIPTIALDGPVVRTGRTKVDPTGLHLIDPARPFCEIGVEQFDYVQLRGCNPASTIDCPAGYECFLHPESQLGMGACLLSNEAERLANLCRDFLVSGRRYTVGGEPKSGDLVLLPRKHVLRTTPLDGCVDDNQCTLLANYAAQLRTDKDPTSSPLVQPVPDPTDGKLKDVSGHQWSCRVDDARASVNPDPALNRRCVQVCATNDDCTVEDDELNRRFGISQFKMVCQSGVCMEGIAPPQQCINGPQRYDVHASEAFVVIGDQSGYVHPFKLGAGDVCERDDSANRLQIGRIPLKAKPCGVADPITGKLLDGSGDQPNPCSTTVTQSELQPIITRNPNSCTTAAGSTQQPAFERQNVPAIQFRNAGMKLTLVDPYYPGDSQCILDREGQLGKIPLVYQGYQISFHQAAGYSPLFLPTIGPSFPVKVVKGPTQSIWILDSGDFLSTSPTLASTRGKVFRVEAGNIGGAASVLQ